MARMELETLIQAPAEKIFAKSIDFPNTADFIEGITKIEMLTEGPVGNGTRFRETRIMFGKEAVEEMEVAEFDPPNGYVLLAENHGCKYRSAFRMQPEGDATRVVLDFEAFPQTLMAKIMSVVTRPLMKSMAKHILKDLEDLKTAVEGEAS